MIFTEEQIQNWQAYERVRQLGVINMFDVRTGGMLSGLSNDEYMFCLKNYSKLRDASEEKGEVK
jgi:hypothetical protein